MVPSLSVEVPPSRSQTRYSHETVKAAVGGTLGFTTGIWWVVECVSPPSSVTVRVAS